MTSLEKLDLAGNQLSGAIPDLSNLTSLEKLYLGDNQLSGSIPTWFNSLTGLTRLFLSTNQLSGTIPAELGELGNLRYLYLNDNDLTGAIPAAFDQLSSLDRFYASGNTNLCLPSDLTTWQGAQLGRDILLLCPPVLAQEYTQNTAIPPLLLPATSGGTLPLTHEFTPALPAGLRFAPDTRRLSGIPTGTQPATVHTDAVTDSAVDDIGNDIRGTARLTLTITVSPDPTSPPGQPVNLTATAGNRQVTLRWNDPGNPSITKYQIRQWASADSQPTTWTDIPGSDADTTSHTVTGLTNGTAYSFRIRAVNTNGDGTASAVATATPSGTPAPPSAPVPPAHFTATAGNRAVTLRWADPNDASITTYQYQWKRAEWPSFRSWVDIPDSDVDTTSFTFFPANNGTAYRVRAVGTGGPGPASDIAPAPPRAPVPPVNFMATAGDRAVTLRWTDPDAATITEDEDKPWTEPAPGTGTDIPGSTATPPATSSPG